MEHTEGLLEQELDWKAGAILVLLEELVSIWE